MQNHITNWELIYVTLGTNGSCNLVLSEEAQLRVRQKGDGFGKMTIGQLKALGIAWDFSHVRDSSDEAIDEMAEQIRVECRLLDAQRRALYGPDAKLTTTLDSIESVVEKLGLQLER